MVPAARADDLARALRSGAWTAGRFNLEAAVRWAADGTVAAIGAAKRADAAERYELVRRHLGGFRVRSDPAAYYCWWELPAPWRAETFAAAAAERLGIAVTPGTAFAVGEPGAGRGQDRPGDPADSGPGPGASVSGRSRRRPVSHAPSASSSPNARTPHAAVDRESVSAS